MKLIDTSSWIEALRERGDPNTRQRVGLLLREGEAAWCDLVRLELWNGVRGGPEKRMLEALERDVILLPTTPAVWAAACTLAQRARARGLTVPATDLLIAATAATHGVELEHQDQHLTELQALR